VISDLFGALNRLGKTIEDSPVTPGQGAELLALIADGTISATLGKQVFEIMLETGQDPGAIVESGSSSRPPTPERSKRRSPA
jgi:aspartyl-tRNA(Asn)/glutamyl-tRNA(Gln) amidotransferase subunit B